MAITTDLVEQARDAATRAYAPYSRFHVGCAIEMIDGTVVLGANMENACYRLGICAEQAALTAAAQAAGLDRIVRIAVAGGRLKGGAVDGTVPVTPCGGCRQSIIEAAHLSGRDIEVIAASGDGRTVEIARISELLPNGFGPATLGG